MKKTLVVTPIGKRWRKFSNMTFYEVSKKLGRNVMSIRLKGGLSTSELSKKAHVDRGTIVDIEKGIANPLLGTLLKIAIALNTQLWRLCEGI